MKPWTRMSLLRGGGKESNTITMHVSLQIGSPWYDVEVHGTRSHQTELKTLTYTTMAAKWGIKLRRVESRKKMNPCFNAGNKLLY
jgi:hypothetical protein